MTTRLLSLPRIAGLALVLMAAPLHAAPPEPLTPYVSDFADILAPAEEARIEEKLKRLRADPAVEVAVATIRAPSDYGSDQSLAQFATQMFNQWGIGHAERNDGVLVLLAVGEREVRIALGSGYPPVWDGRALRVIDAMMLPELRRDNYAAGVMAGLEGLEVHLLRPFKAGQTFTGTEGMPEAQNSWLDADLALFLGLVLAAGGFIAWNERHRLGDRLAKRRPCPNCGRAGIKVEEHRSESADDAGHTTLHVLRRCPHCAWREERSEEVSERRETKDHEGGGGFGGGNSSGGGASGRF